MANTRADLEEGAAAAEQMIVDRGKQATAAPAAQPGTPFTDLAMRRAAEREKSGRVGKV